MELFPIVERRNKLNDNLWYVVSPSSNVQVKGGVGAKLVSRDSDVYVTCGAQPDQSFGSVYHLSLDTFRLTKMQEELHPRYEHAAALHNSQIFVFGGADTSGNRNDLQKLDLVCKKVIEDSGGEPPSPRTIHNVGFHEGRLLVWGGGDAGSAPVEDTALHSLCLETGKWSRFESVGDIPCSRHGHVVCCVGDKLYVHAGMTGPNILDDLHYTEISDLKSDCAWTKQSTSGRQPVARAAHSSAPHNQHFYIFGGFTGQQALDDLWRFDTDGGKWSEVIVQEPRPPPRLDLTICTSRLPVSNQAEGGPKEKEDEAQAPPRVHDITSLLHESAQNNDESIPDTLPELPVSEYQDVLVLFGGMDLLGNIFNDIYTIKL